MKAIKTMMKTLLALILLLAVAPSPVRVKVVAKVAELAKNLQLSAWLCVRFAHGSSFPDRRYAHPLCDGAREMSRYHAIFPWYLVKLGEKNA